MECRWPGCPNAALGEPVPNLVDVPDNPGAEDGPVFFCTDHRTEYSQAWVAGPQSAEMRRFVLKMNGGTDEDADIMEDVRRHRHAEGS